MESEQPNAQSESDEYYTVTSVHKDDLRRLYRGDSTVLRIIDELDDRDMSWLARKLEDDYVQQLYWDSLQINFERRFLNEETRR